MNREGGIDQSGALEFARLLTEIGSRGELRETFVSDPVAAAEESGADPERMGNVLEILASYTPEQRSFLLELNETWPLRMEVEVDAISKLQMPF